MGEGAQRGAEAHLHTHVYIYIYIYLYIHIHTPARPRRCGRARCRLPPRGPASVVSVYALVNYVLMALLCFICFARRGEVIIRLSVRSLGEHKPGRIKPVVSKGPLYPSKTKMIIFVR